MEKKIIYLTQCPEALPNNYNCLKNRTHLVLSFKTNTSDTDIFFPNSTWTTGRNKLFQVAIQKDYDYYVFLDGDLNLSEEVLQKFENILNELDCPIIVPEMWGYNLTPGDYDIPNEHNRQGLTNDSFKIQTVDWYDAAFNAFNKNSIRELLPYEFKYDAESWHYSQLLLILKSNFLFKNQIIQINDIHITNDSHSDYPRSSANIRQLYNSYIAENSMEKLEMSNPIEIYTHESINLEVNKLYPGHKKIISIVYKLLKNYKNINFIDVGVAIGDILRHMKDAGFNLNKITSIGIDTLLNDYRQDQRQYLSNYNVLLNCAISIKDNEEADFFVNESLACSSLNELNYEYISNEKKEDIFYFPNDVNSLTTILKKITLKTRTINSIIKELKLDREIIHFLKVDAQGQDLNVIKSCGQYLENILFIMIETTMPDIKNGTLYKNSTTFTEDYEFLKNNNFELLCLEKLLESDADALFYNKSLIKQPLENYIIQI